QVARVVAVYPDGMEDTLFLKGVRLAVGEVNAAGGVNGVPVLLEEVAEVPYTDHLSLEPVVARTLRLAADIVRRPDLLAVIGHTSSATAVPASSVYARANVLFLATHATAVSLTNHGFDTVFGLQVSDADTATVMAHYATQNGLRRLVVLADGSGYGSDVGGLFRSAAALRGAEILHRGLLSSHNRSIDRLLLFLLDNTVFKPGDIDAFFVASASHADTANFITRARQLGLTQPILGPESLFSDRIARLAGPAMKDVAAASLYDVEDRSDEATSFAERFVTNTGGEPDLLAAVGYDAVKLLAFAAAQARSRDPKVLADALRVIRHEAPFIGATGPMVFDANGLVTDTGVFVVRHDGRAFRTVARYRKPLDLPPGAPALKDTALDDAAPKENRPKETPVPPMPAPATSLEVKP
ncbi:MAG TPA: ABC transporter substrate-binding protein, partial [Azospirillum sp.]